MVSGVAVSRNRELLNGRWDKNDTKCAANVADLISQGKCLFYESPISEIIELRELFSLRERMKKNYHIFRMRIRNTLIAKYFPEFDRYFGRSFKDGLAIVKWCLSPYEIAGMEFDDFARTVTSSRPRLSQNKRLREIYDLAIESIGCPMNHSAQFEAQMTTDLVKQGKTLIKAIDEKIAQVADKFEEYHLLLTIPGFGPYVSALVLSKISDPSRFENRGQVLKLAGFDLSAKRSGKGSAKAIPHISKKGSNALRYALFQAALVASSRNEHFIKYFTNKLEGRSKERGIRIKMRVKLAAKMLIIAWTLMKKKTVFDPDFLIS